MSRPCSLKDIAQECGVSVSTVSQILKNSPRDYSSEQTRAKVRETARKLGYRRNYGYRLMRGQKTMTVAIMASMEHMRSEEHVSKLVIELMSCFDRHGYASYFNTFVYDAQENLNKVRDLLARGVECFVAVGAPVGHKELEREIEGQGGYLISTSHEFRNHIFMSDLSASRRIVCYLYERAGENFCFFPCSNPLPGRFAALKEVFKHLSQEELLRRHTCRCISYKECRGNYPDFAFREGYAATEKACGMNPRLRGFFYENDGLALGGIAYLVQSGRQIGRDVWVAGYNNDSAIRNAPYPVSSVDHDWEHHAPLFVEKALKNEPCQTVLDTTAHIREYIPGTNRIHEIDFVSSEEEYESSK